MAKNTNSQSCCGKVVVKFLVALLAFPVAASLSAAEMTETKNRANHYIKAELGGDLQEWPGGIENVPVLRVNEIYWQLKIDKKKTLGRSWKKLVGKSVVVTGTLEIRPDEPTKKDKGIVRQTNYYVNVQTLAITPKSGKKK